MPEGVLWRPPPSAPLAEEQSAIYPHLDPITAKAGLFGTQKVPSQDRPILDRRAENSREAQLAQAARDLDPVRTPRAFVSIEDLVA